MTFSPLGEAAELVNFFSTRYGLARGTTNGVSINASPYSKGCFCFELGLKG